MAARLPRTHLGEMRPFRAPLGLAAVLLGLLICTSVAADPGDAAGEDAAAAAADCEAGCTFDVLAVCGADGEWYQNACIMACSGEVDAAANATLCEGAQADDMSGGGWGPRGALCAPPRCARSACGAALQPHAGAARAGAARRPRRAGGPAFRGPKPAA